MAARHPVAGSFYKMMRQPGYILLLLSFLLLSCGASEWHSRLDHIDMLSDSDAKAAIRALSAINPDILDEDNRQYYNLLQVKTCDKAFIRHVSDSLIKIVMNYYSVHGDRKKYAESLYYGGRVYCDLGDYPTALECLQSSLHEVGEKDKLRGNIFASFVWIYNTLRLYDKALPFSEEVIKIDKQLNDTVNLIMDLESKGDIYLKKNEYNSAKMLFSESYRLSINYDDNQLANAKMYLAAIHLRKGEYDLALNMIRGVPEKITDTNYVTALGYAADIYYKSQRYDTAFYYAHKLANIENSSNRKSGFRKLLYPELMAFIPRDSVVIYASRYADAVEAILDKNGDEEALIQSSMYNYQLHERERNKAETKSARLKIIVLFFVIAVLILGFAVCIVIYRNRMQLIRLRNSIKIIKELRQRRFSDSNILENVIRETVNPVSLTSDVTSDSNEVKVDSSDDSKLNLSLTTRSIDDEKELLRLRLREELDALYREGGKRDELSPIIAKSDAYDMLQGYISQEKFISEKSDLWEDLELTILQASPDFNYRLELLSGKSKLNKESINYHLALLIKCGVTPTQLKFLLGREKGTISYRRKMLCKRLFNDKESPEYVDFVIYLL